MWELKKRQQKKTTTLYLQLNKMKWSLSFFFFFLRLYVCCPYSYNHRIVEVSDKAAEDQSQHYLPPHPLPLFCSFSNTQT